MVAPSDSTRGCVSSYDDVLLGTDDSCGPKPQHLGLHSKNDGGLTRLEYRLRGRIFRGAKPRSVAEIQTLKDRNITHIVSLLSGKRETTIRDNETEEGRVPIEEIYKQSGFVFISFPIENFQIPDEEELKLLINQIKEDAASVENAILIHCKGGRGRTGLVAACMAKTILGLPGDEAIKWTRERIPGAIETASQEAFVKNFNG